jgi:hypothetical protein
MLSGATVGAAVFLAMVETVRNSGGGGAGAAAMKSVARPAGQGTGASTLVASGTINVMRNSAT